MRRRVPPRAAAIRRGFVFLTIGLLCLLVVYHHSNFQKLYYYRNFLFSAFRNVAFNNVTLLNITCPKCRFSQRLKLYVEAGVINDRFANLMSPLHPSSVHTVIGQATVFYVWCGVVRRYFEFRNYLSVRSVLRTLRPDVLWFYYEAEPDVDSRLYNTWWQELRKDVPFLHHENLHAIASELKMNACDYHGRPSLDFVYELVTSRGGTFVDESTVIVSRPPEDGLTAAIDATNTSVIRLRLLKAQCGASCPEQPSSRSSQNIRVITCPSRSQFNNEDITLCFHLAQSLYPKDIWWLNSTVGGTLRLQFYGSLQVPKQLPSYDHLAPNVGHMVWVGGGKMDFLFFLCVVSLLHVAKVDIVYIHGDSPPTGFYWDLLMKTGQKVQHVRRQDVRQVFGQRVGSRSHLSDVWRADIMRKYGGVYSDTDAIFVQPLSRRLRAYDVVVSLDVGNWGFPDSINLGVLVSKPGARFWQLFMESMKWFRTDDFGFNGLRQPYRVMERHPDVVHVDPHLQVICAAGHCYPTWWPDFRSDKASHTNPPPGVAPLDWRKDAFAFHFTYGSPEFQNPSALNRATGLNAEIGRMVLTASGMAKYFNTSN